MFFFCNRVKNKFELDFSELFSLWVFLKNDISKIKN